MKLSNIFSEVQLLDPSECAEIHEKILSLREHWIQRNALPFYTLGAAAYLDVQDFFELDLYLQRARELNPILTEHFTPLYHTLISALEDTFAETFMLEEQFALPGFHIFEPHTLFWFKAGSIHFDRQHKIYQQRLESYDHGKTLSFTMAIEIPSFGAGMNLWDLRSHECVTLPEDQVKELILAREMTACNYQSGVLVIHDGQTLHQIRSQRSLKETQARITFQGHGVFIDDHWRLYF